MSTPDTCSAVRRHHRRIEPEVRFDRPAVAVALVDVVVHVPRRNETIVLLLDDARRGIHLVSVTGTDDPDDVVEVVELLTAPNAHRARADAVVLASVWSGARSPRPRRPIVDRWLELHQIAADRGVELLDWFDVTDRARSLRVEAGAPSRW